jgi:hypothetical protein
MASHNRSSHSSQLYDPNRYFHSAHDSKLDAQETHFFQFYFNTNMNTDDNVLEYRKSISYTQSSTP